MANLCIKTPSSAIQVLKFQLLVLRPRPNEQLLINTTRRDKMSFSKNLPRVGFGCEGSLFRGLPPPAIRFLTSKGESSIFYIVSSCTKFYFMETHFFSQNYCFYNLPFFLGFYLSLQVIIWIKTARKDFPFMPNSQMKLSPADATNAV